MAKHDETIQHLLAENEQMKLRLQEAEELLEAIRSGEVDALVVSAPNGDQIYTLTGSDQAYRLLFETMNEGAAILGSDGTVFFCNAGLSSMLKTPMETILGGSILRFVTAEDCPSFKALLKRGLDEPRKTEFGLKSHEGDIVPCQISTSPLRVEDSSHICMIVSDLTDRKRAEEAIQASEDRYKGVFENAAVGIDLLDSNGRFLQVNSCLAEMLGYTQDELLSLTIYDISHPDDVEVSRINYENLVNGETESYRFEKRYIRKNGEALWADVSASAVRRPDGSYVVTVGVIADLTDRKRAEEALQAANAYNRSLIEASLDPHVTISPEGKITDVNKATERVTGYSRDELIGTDFADYFAGPQEAREGYLRAFTEGTVKDYELEIRHRDGGLTPVMYNVSVYRDLSGEIVGLFAAARDISERKASERLIHVRLNLLEFAASRPLDDLLQKTLDEIGALTNSPIGFYHVVESDQKTLSLQAWSTRTVEEFCKAAGKGQHDSIDRAGVWVDCIRERKPVIHNDYSSLPHRKGMPERHAAVIRELGVPIIRSGRIVAVLGIGNKPTDYTENDIEVVSHLADVSWEIATHKRAQEALKESEQQYRTLFEDSIDGVYSVLRDGTITDANPAFCELFGYATEEMIGKDIRELFLDPADCPRFQDEIEKHGFVKDYEVKFRKRDGTEVDCLLSSSVHFGKDGSVTGYRSIVRDLTASKALQRQLQQAQKMEAVGTLAGGIAHDFNNILQVVLGYSELVLAHEDLPNNLRQDLEKVLLSGRTGADLVQRLLTFSRKTETKPLNLDLNQRIRQTQKFLERTIPKMINIELILADDLARIHADPTQVDQVLMNLAVNARDAMPEGGKLLIETANVVLDEDYARSHVEAKPGEYVLLRVSDTGLGMDKETLEHIFEPFYTTKAMGQGTGLGLAMVFGIVKQHRGFISCYSEVGYGTTFKIYLPAVIVETQSDEPVVTTVPQGGMETILLVDDEEFIRDLGKRILERSGYTVLTAANGMEALNLYERERGKISLVILDLIMPEMGGKQCLESLLRLNPSVKVVIASGYSASGPARDALSAGAKGFVNKPYNILEVLNVVRTVLDEDMAQ